jgi:HEAT repeat protein
VDRPEIARVLGSDLSTVALKEPAPFTDAAAETLARLCPSAPITITALQGMLSSTDKERRLIGGKTLVILTQALAPPRDHPFLDTASARSHVLTVATATVKTAGAGLDDADARADCLEAARQAALALNRVVCAPQLRDLEANGGDARRRFEQEWSYLGPVLLAFKAQAPALMRALADHDPKIQLLARKTLEELALGRQQLAAYAKDNNLVLAAALDPEIGAANGSHSGAEDPLLNGLRTTLPALVAGIADPDARQRLKAIDVLERMGPAAEPAAAALVRALGDSDRFVRWSAARVLGKIAPAKADQAVPALTKLLAEEDVDVRLAAIRALGHYGRAARESTPRLVALLRAPDAETRLAALRAVSAIGTDAASAAAPVLWELVADPDARVRQRAVDLLNRLQGAETKPSPHP